MNKDFSLKNPKQRNLTEICIHPIYLNNPDELTPSYQLKVL